MKKRILLNRCYFVIKFFKNKLANCNSKKKKNNNHQRLRNLKNKRGTILAIPLVRVNTKDIFNQKVVDVEMIEESWILYLLLNYNRIYTLLGINE